MKREVVLKHCGGRGLEQDGSLDELVRKRYQSFDTELGAEIEAGKADFNLLEKKVIEWGEPKVGSAKQVTFLFFIFKF